MRWTDDYIRRAGHSEDPYCAVLKSKPPTAKPCDVVVSKEHAGNILKELNDSVCEDGWAGTNCPKKSGAVGVQQLGSALLMSAFALLFF